MVTSRPSGHKPSILKAGRWIEKNCFFSPFSCTVNNTIRCQRIISNWKGASIFLSLSLSLSLSILKGLAGRIEMRLCHGGVPSSSFSRVAANLNNKKGGKRKSPFRNENNKKEITLHIKNDSWHSSFHSVTADVVYKSEERRAMRLFLLLSSSSPLFYSTRIVCHLTKSRGRERSVGGRVFFIITHNRERRSRVECRQTKLSSVNALCGGDGRRRRREPFLFFLCIYFYLDWIFNRLKRLMPCVPVSSFFLLDFIPPRSLTGKRYIIASPGRIHQDL